MMTELEKYYNKFNEEKRLKSRHGQVEFITSMKYIHKYLPKREHGQVKILDVGAGTGRYSVALAEEGYDVTKEPIPVVPAQHYFMGGIWVDSDSQTSMERLFAAGETSCNGVHGKNRLASNSLLESLVFAKRAAVKIQNEEKGNEDHEFESNYHAACC